MYRMELKVGISTPKVFLIIAAASCSFLMYRMELKDLFPFFAANLAAMFLMYRMELKATLISLRACALACCS